MIINLFSCLLWGTLSALALTALCVFIANGLSGRKTNLLIAAILFILLGYECVLGAGALYVRGYVSDLGEYVGILTENTKIDESQDIADALKDKYPAIPESVIENLKDAADGVTSVSQLTNAVTKSVNDSIMSYFWTRFFWALGFMAAGTILFVYTAPKNKKSTYHSYNNDFGSTSYDTDYNTTTTSRSRYSDFD